MRLAPPYSPPETRETALHEAARQGNTDEIAPRYNEIPFDTKNEDGDTPLEVAIKARQTGAVITLLTAPDLVNKTPVWASLMSIGQRFFDRGHFAEALTMHLKAHEFAEQLFFPGDPHLIKTVQRIAVCYFNLGNYKQARVYFRDEYRMEPEEASKIEILHDIALSYFQERSYQLALETYRQVYEDLRPLGSAVELARILNYISLCLSNLGKYSEAIEHLDEAYLTMRFFTEEVHPCMIDSLGEMAFCFQQLGNQKEANTYRELAYRLAIELFGENDPLTLQYKEAQ